MRFLFFLRSFDEERSLLSLLRCFSFRRFRLTLCEGETVSTDFVSISLHLTFTDSITAPFSGVNVANSAVLLAGILLLSVHCAMLAVFDFCSVVLSFFLCFLLGKLFTVSTIFTSETVELLQANSRPPFGRVVVFLWNLRLVGLFSDVGGELTLQIVLGEAALDGGDLFFSIGSAGFLSL